MIVKGCVGWKICLHGGDSLKKERTSRVSNAQVQIRKLPFSPHKVQIRTSIFFLEAKREKKYARARLKENKDSITALRMMRYCLTYIYLY